MLTRRYFTLTLTAMIAGLSCPLMGCGPSSNASSGSIRTMTSDEIEELMNKQAGIDTSLDSDDIDKYADAILMDGGEYIVVAKRQQDVTQSWTEIGVLDEQRNWVVPLSKDAPIIGNDGDLTYPDPNIERKGFDAICQAIRRNVTYLGNGVFLLAYSMTAGNGTSFLEGYTFNVNTNKWINTNRFNVGRDGYTFHEGYVILDDTDYSWGGAEVILLADDGSIIDTDIVCQSTSYTGPVSEGKFFSYDGFYNVISLERVIDLSEYAGMIKNQPAFNNGECEIIVRNPDGIRFKAIIDKSGNFITDFEQL